MKANRYRPVWFGAFLRTYWPEPTAKEVTFTARRLPPPAYQSVLDVRVELGRHALPLAMLATG